MKKAFELVSFAGINDIGEVVAPSWLGFDTCCNGVSEK